VRETTAETHARTEAPGALAQEMAVCGAQDDSYWRVIWTEADANDPKLCGPHPSSPILTCTSCTWG